MSVKIKELPNSERPYEKLEMYGEKMLSNSELLAIIIKTGTKYETAVDLAKRVLNINHSNKKDNLNFLRDISIEEFMAIKGIGKVKAIQIKAVIELSNRMSRPINELKVRIKNSKDVFKLFTYEMQNEKRELVKLIILNIKNEVVKIIDVCTGGTNFAVIGPKDILIEPIKINAPRIILVHNHPSGDPKPSQSDYLVTDRIYEASQIMGIELLDHIIIGKNSFESIFKNKRYIKDV